MAGLLGVPLPAMPDAEVSDSTDMGGASGHPKMFLG
jgi:hypothetical protein